MLLSKGAGVREDEDGLCPVGPAGPEGTPKALVHLGETGVIYFLVCRVGPLSDRNLVELKVTDFLIVFRKCFSGKK